jgi:ATP-dependent protease ClpP protease subunit
MMKIIIDGVIGWDVLAEDVREQLNKAEGQDVVIEISSPGGFIWDGLTIFNLIKNYSGKTTIVLMGLAASMASYIALSANVSKAEKNAVYMIHNAGNCVCGDYRDMQEQAVFLEGLTNLLAKTYSEKSGKPLDEIRAMMDDTTWLYGEEMVDAGFIDEVIEGDSNDSKPDAVAFSKLRFEECNEIMRKEAKSSKENLLKAAALIPQNKKEDLIDKNKNNDKKPANNADEKKERLIMTLEELKAEHPALYKEVFDAGVTKERDRATAHIKWGVKSGNMAFACECIENGKSTTEEMVVAEYMTSGMNKQSLNDMQDDDPGNTQPPKDTELSEDEQVSALVAKTVNLAKGGV